MHTKAIFEYLEKLYKSSPMDLEILKQVAGLVGDLMKLYGKKIQEIPNLHFVIPMLDTLGTSTHSEYRSTVAWCKKVINEIKAN